MTLLQMVQAAVGWLFILMVLAIAMLIPAMGMWAIGYAVEPWAVYLATVYSATVLAREIWRAVDHGQ